MIRRAFQWFFGIQSAVACIVAKNGKILLTKRSPLLMEGGKWCLPGGGIKRWEKSVDAARRELYEETGLKSKNTKLLFVHEEIVRRLKLHADVFVYGVKTTGDVRANWEVSDYGWFTRAQIAKMPIAFSHKDIIDKYGRGGR